MQIFGQPRTSTNYTSPASGRVPLPSNEPQDRFTASESSEGIGPPPGWRPPSSWRPAASTELYKGAPVDKDGNLVEEHKPMSTLNRVELVADLLGILDPTPLCDLVGGGISLYKGDRKGAALSAVSAFVPYAGDALAKPAKLAMRFAKELPHLTKFASPARIQELAQTLRHGGSDLVRSAQTLNNYAKRAEEAYANPAWRKFAEKENLPHDGPIPFVPHSKSTPSNPKKGPNGGFMDAFGNEWTKGNTRTRGEHKEWDVIPKGPEGGIAPFAHDRQRSHVNVSQKGIVTH